MTDNIVIEYVRPFIHARQYGPDSYEASLELWNRIVSACEKHSCFNILGESFTTVELSTIAAYDHVKIFRSAGVTWKHRIAWVHHVEETADAMRLVETVLVNRGLANGRLFPTVEEAKQWLLGDAMEQNGDTGED